MTAHDVLKSLVDFCHMVARTYLEDLTDEQLLVRPVPQCNHIAWQLGHLITSDQQMLTELGHPAPALPPGFAERHTKETATSDKPAQFCKKSEYLALMDRMKAAVLAAIDATPANGLDRPAPESMRGYAPTVADALSLLGTHWLMHAGQWVPIRRKLGKPPLF